MGQNKRDARLTDWRLSESDVIYSGWDTIILQLTYNDIDKHSNISHSDWLILARAYTSKFPVNSSYEYINVGNNEQLYVTYKRTYVSYDLITDDFTIPFFTVKYGVAKFALELTIHGSFFRYARMQHKQWLDSFNYYISNVIRLPLPTIFLYASIDRADFCFDLMDTLVDDYYNSLTTDNKNKEMIKRKGTTYYVGSRRSDYIFARLYDKVADLLWRNKIYMYEQYLCDKPITRIEFQAGWAFGGGGYTLASIEHLKTAIMSYAGVENYNAIFRQHLQYDPYIIIDVNKYLQRWKKMTKKLLYNGINLTSPLSEINDASYSGKLHYERQRRKST